MQTHPSILLILSSAALRALGICLEGYKTLVGASANIQYFM